MKSKKARKSIKVEREEISIEEIKKLLEGKFIILDCGHRFTTHHWSNTFIMTCDGKTYCHNCY